MSRFLTSWLVRIAALSLFELGLDASPKFDDPFVKVVLVRIDPELPLARDLDCPQSALSLLRREPNGADHFRSLAGQEFRRDAIGKREPKRAVCRQIVDPDGRHVGGLASRFDPRRIAGAHWEDVRIGHDLNERRELRFQISLS